MRKELKEGLTNWNEKRKEWWKKVYKAKMTETKNNEKKNSNAFGKVHVNENGAVKGDNQ